MKKHIIILASISNPVFADPQVITTVGHTFDAEKYLHTSLFVSKKGPAADTGINVDQFAQSINQQYNVKTTKLTPGVEPSRKVHFPQLARPIFIVGDDQTSTAWLSDHKDRLLQLKAIGFIVSLSGKGEYDQIAAQTGFNLIPVNGDSFSGIFQIQHYPVLISRRLIEQ